jgi:predicted metal-dependent hydrolase
MQLNLAFDSPFAAPGRSESVERPAPLESLEPPNILFVRHPRARRYVVTVRDDGVVRVTVPRRGSMREAREFAGRQQAWIERQRRLLEQERSAAPPVEEDAMRQARMRAGRELPPRLMTLAAEHGLTVSKISVRNQKWRWGSCSRRGHICLNWRLVETPAWVRDYVMIHELMHLRRMDHSRKFWKLVAQACPDYQAARQWLREHGRSL